MQLTQILSLAGATIGVITIVLGIVALATPTWIILTASGQSQQIEATYGLFERCDKLLTEAPVPSVGCVNLKNFQTAQGLTIAGVIILALGIIMSILVGVFVKNRWIKSTPQVLLIIGPTLILIGLLYYVKNVLGHFTQGLTTLDLGYSFILILITCIIGYISAAYFLFVTGFVQGYHRGRLAIFPKVDGKQ